MTVGPQLNRQAKVENPTMQTMDIDKDTYANKPRKKDDIGVTFSANFQWWKRPSGVAAVCLGLLYVLLLAGIIGLSVYYNRVIGHYYSAARFQTSSLNNLTKERDHLKEELNKQSSGWQKFESSWYYLSTEKKSWTESRQDCLKRGAHLVIINSKKEQEFIHEWSGCLDIYLGFHDTNTEGVWEWINDGALGQSSAPGTTYWRDGEPNDADQGEDCAQLSNKVSDPLKSWNDVPCTTALHWMCEKTPSTL
ncbi:hepatic lectin isoform X2 [Salmo salar]|uniref:Hepatic lectin isoform X2 n=1 Tax=Salmo salar TaxID=8030 RepID=A0ABM3EEG5_SALSA|nr:hepatic lectin-like isoform X2 [Salmo salar]